MKKKFPIFAAALVASCNLASAAVLSVNLGSSGLPAETGFTDWTTADKSAPAPTTISGINLSLVSTVSDAGAGKIRSINRADATTGNTTLNNLTQSWWGARAATFGTTGGSLTLRLEGFAAGNYTWTSWHHDHSDQVGTMDIFLSTDDGVSFTQVADSFQIVAGDSAATPNPFSVGFTSLGTDASNAIQIRFTNDVAAPTSPQAFALVNGFQVTVPEPSTALLGALGFLALLRRRRG